MISTEFIYQIYLGILQTLSIDSIKSSTNSIYEFYLQITSKFILLGAVLRATLAG